MIMNIHLFTRNDVLIILIDSQLFFHKDHLSELQLFGTIGILVVFA